MKNNVKIIFHVDMNAFFCSVEEIQNPFLKNKPFAVCSRFSNKGIVSTASYAARKYGVHSAMSKPDALRACKNLICVDHHFDQYHEYSIMFMNLLREYTSIYVQASIDEAYLDMTELCQTRNALELAKEIQERILNELNLPCSIGIGPNLFLAKMGSDFKKPLGITVLRYRDCKKMLWPLDIGEMFGVGKKTVPRLNRIGIKTIGDFATYEGPQKIIEVLGLGYYQDILGKCYGKGTNIIDMHPYVENTSIGHSTTFDDTCDNDVLIGYLQHLSRMVERRVKNSNMQGRTVTIVIKYFDFKSITRSRTLLNKIDSYADIYEIAEDLFQKNYNGQLVRLLGVTLSHLEKGEGKKQPTIFDIDEIEKEQKVLDVKKEISKRFGEKVIVKRR